MISVKKIKKVIGILLAVLGIAFIVMNIVAKKRKGDSVYDNDPEQKNPLTGKKVTFVEDENDEVNADGVRGHLEVTGISECKSDFYDKYIKRFFDIVLSFAGLVVLSPVYLAIAIAIMIDDPGPILFTQKRVGKNKEYFKLHKFRSMKMSTPHDVPTHMLENPEQYITRVGKFLRAHSLDELPQIWDIFIGNMSIIGPRPGLWNQDVLTAERDKYGANDVKPGLTGWAQINGRDELELSDKAKLDGEYVKKESLVFDMKCFFGTALKVFHDDTVIEGSKGEERNIQRTFSEDIDTSAKITLGIVTYNSEKEISNLLDSIQSANCYEKIGVYIVDNGSSDNTVNILKNEYPWVHLYESKYNLGFGRGHNIIINHVRSKYHIIVNPDIRIDQDVFVKIEKYMDENPDIVAVTPLVRNIDGSQQFLPKRNPTMKYMIGGFLEKYSKRCAKLRNEYTLKDQIIVRPIDVEFCSGCFMITRTEALLRIGGFDERYFLHFEDADLTRELKKIGRTVYNPDIEVVHKWERDNRKINKSFWIALKSMFIYMKKWS